jgi:hypothetical protein
MTTKPRRLFGAIVEGFLWALCILFLYVWFFVPGVEPSGPLTALPEWGVVPVGALALVIGIAIGRWRYGLASIDTEPRCEKCGYLLRGLPEPRCPECGTPFDPDIRNRGNA